MLLTTAAISFTLRNLIAATTLVVVSACLPAVRQPEIWVEVRSPHFTVVSNAGDTQARRTADRFEQMRAVFQTALPDARVRSGKPLTILAVRDEASLKALIPEFWETEGQKHPEGIFAPRPEKSYVALRVDVEVDNPYQVVYHEYVHQLVQLNFERIPLWLNEGLAEFYGSTTITRNEVRLGQAVPRHLALLRRQENLPLGTVLTADRTSAHYNEADKAPSFYAQSWVLSHYLLLGDRGVHKPKLYGYLELLGQGVDELEAARRAFGDLGRLSVELRRYSRQRQFYYLPIPPPVTLDTGDFSVRELSTAELAAVLGGFHVHMGHLAEARAWLEQAVALDPDLAVAQESMGLLTAREGKLEDALPWLERAVHLDPGNFLAHYYLAVLSLQGRATSARLTRAERGLRRATELNPEFAPAYSTLAALYAALGTRLEEALRLARKGAELEPGVMQHRLVAANVLLRMGRVADAEDLGRRALNTAQSQEERAAAATFLEGLPGRGAEHTESTGRVGQGR